MLWKVFRELRHVFLVQWKINGAMESIQGVTARIPCPMENKMGAMESIQGVTARIPCPMENKMGAMESIQGVTACIPCPTEINGVTARIPCPTESKSYMRSGSELKKPKAYKNTTPTREWHHLSSLIFSFLH
ncbi:hypothetical protein M3936_13595 [Sutcliffiella horikoshii]|uniref:hypothetical protein n=1 Tax=Sutcliffiella horikoshii TaxID=79883 RepID=UPI00203EBBAB|nr:hypothetical protein [Sutcliffiella horikoshii]MCM3618618.1 hypothetical protein [Sutcliffiella horikoshii]